MKTEWIRLLYERNDYENVLQPTKNLFPFVTQLLI